MLPLPPELLVYSKYLAPPLVGAFIGYLTNRVAIRMLFRPLRAWRVMGVRMPMTPGVIPAKREELAKNMGEVVGDHLLTGRDIAKGLQQEAFQRHLYNLIHERMEGVLQKDLGTLASIVPEKYQVYFEVGKKTLGYQIKEQIRGFIASNQFRTLVEQVIGERVEEFFEQDAGTLFTLERRETAYAYIEKTIAAMLAGPALEQWVRDTIELKVAEVLRQGKSLADILPDSLTQLLEETIVNQTPALLNRLAALVGEPEVRGKIVKGACAGIDNFISSLGGMADMVRGFLRMDTVEAKIHNYLLEKEDDITRWLQSEEVQARVVAILGERSRSFLHKPIADWATKEEDFVAAFCSQSARQIVAMLQSDDVPVMLTAMMRSSFEEHFRPGDLSLQQLGAIFLGGDAVDSAREWLSREIGDILQSPSTMETVDSLVDLLLSSLLQKRLGKLGNIIPAGVRQGMAQSLQRMATGMLEREVPDLVQSLNIKRMVTQKINSLDILKVEGLLLSIMEEHFKYINLFGALLGFLIGCGNLLFI